VMMNEQIMVLQNKVEETMSKHVLSCFQSNYPF
jgi:hypothetical protein